jgi:hypothetical protein
MAPRSVRRLETWLWTGPVGHLIAGVMDWLVAVTGWLAYALRRRIARARKRR